MTNLYGSNKNYNYAGIKGDFSNLGADNKIRAIWYNNTDQPVTFTPRISFVDEGRMNPETDISKWLDMTEIKIFPHSHMVAEFDLNQIGETTFNVININVNYTNNRALGLKRIEWVDQSFSETSQCVL